MQLEPLLKSLLITVSVQGETRMKGGLMSEIRSVDKGTKFFQSN